jgi:nitroreductase
MDFFKLMTEARTCRRYQARELEPGMLRWLVDCARIMPCTANAQVLRYLTVQAPQKRAEVFDALGWAGYLQGWKPEEKERPAGYIVLLAPPGEDGKLSNNNYIDMGIAGQTIQLAAWTRGVGACMFRTYNPQKIGAAIDIPAACEIVLVMAFGYPLEERRIAPVPADGSIRYYRDDQGVHYVPKRELGEVLLGEF